MIASVSLSISVLNHSMELTQIYAFNNYGFQVKFHSYKTGLITIYSLRIPLWQEHLREDIL
jgi:hypothetical protein